ncbi:hypothetical protein [Paraburkholderia terrae]|nr:hypothetical protein [Paraburkholderia terrae]
MPTKMTNAPLATDALLETFDVHVLDSIHAHLEEQGGASAAYVVPMKRIFIQAGNTEERCVVIVVPRMSRQHVDIDRERIYSEMRIAPDRTHRACLILANGSVALTEAAVSRAGPLVYKRLMVVWMFADAIALSEYRYRDDHQEELNLVSRKADRHGHLERRSISSLHLAAQRTVIEVFDCFEMDSEIPS